MGFIWEDKKSVFFVDLFSMVLKINTVNRGGFAQGGVKLHRA
jgi:hypothetical protein